MSFIQPSRADKLHDDMTAEKSLMCRATECPQRWSVGPQNLCSAHAWADPKEWPAITDRLLREFSKQTENRPEQDYPELSLSQKREILTSLSGVIKGQKDHKAWAKRLRDREANGEHLSSIQKAAWREALREHFTG